MNKRIIKQAVALSLCAIITAVVSFTAFAADSVLGKITPKDSSSIASGVDYKTYTANDGSKTRNINEISFSSKDSDYMVLPYFGTDLASRHTMTEMAQMAQKEGYEVVAGVNGDFFFTEGAAPTGMPRGPVIQNDKIICTEDFPPNINNMSAEDWQSIGFKRDGTAVTGHFITNRTITMQQDDGTTTEANLTVMNRAMLEMGIHLYTKDYGKKVTSNNEMTLPNYVVELSVEQGNFKLGETNVCKVEKITPEAKDVDIPQDENKIILCTQVNYITPEDMEVLKTMFEGQRVDISIMPQEEEWNDVYQVISGPNAIVSAGEITDRTAAIPDNYPSSIIGVKADGGYVLTQIDGRNMGGSYGIGPILAGKYMKALGCKNALLFDGGGSSELVVKDGDSFKICNKPSDGQERSVGTCLLIVKKTDVYTNPVAIKEAPAYSASFMYVFKPYLIAICIAVPIILIAVIVIIIVRKAIKKKKLKTDNSTKEE